MVIPDKAIKQEVTKRNLQYKGTIWSDNKRKPGSCWGPNITDLQWRICDRPELIQNISQKNYNGKVNTEHPSKLSFYSPRDKKDVPLDELLGNLSYHFATASDSLGSLGNITDVEKVITSSSVSVVTKLEDNHKANFSLDLYTYRDEESIRANLVIVFVNDTASLYLVDHGRKNLGILDDDDETVKAILAEVMTKTNSKGQQVIHQSEDFTKEEKRANNVVVLSIPLILNEQYRPKKVFRARGISKGGSVLKYIQQSSSNPTLISKGVKTVKQSSLCINDDDCDYDTGSNEIYCLESGSELECMSDNECFMVDECSSLKPIKQFDFANAKLSKSDKTIGKRSPINLFGNQGMKYRLDRESMIRVEIMSYVMCGESMKTEQVTQIVDRCERMLEKSGSQKINIVEVGSIGVTGKIGGYGKIGTLGKTGGYVKTKPVADMDFIIEKYNMKVGNTVYIKKKAYKVLGIAFDAEENEVVASLMECFKDETVINKTATQLTEAFGY